MENTNGFMSLDDIMDGAITERFNHVLRQVLDNIADPNTAPEKIRKITLTLAIKPNEERDIATITAEAKPTLVPRKSVGTVVSLFEQDGVTLAAELTKQLPGQMDIEGNENQPKVRPIDGLRAGGSKQ